MRAVADVVDETDGERVGECDDVLETLEAQVTHRRPMGSGKTLVVSMLTDAFSGPAFKDGTTRKALEQIANVAHDYPGDAFWFMQTTARSALSTPCCEELRTELVAEIETSEANDEIILHLREKLAEDASIFETAAAARAVR